MAIAQEIVLRADDERRSCYVMAPDYATGKRTVQIRLGPSTSKTIAAFSERVRA